MSKFQKKRRVVLAKAGEVRAVLNLLRRLVGIQNSR